MPRSHASTLAVRGVGHREYPRVDQLPHAILNLNPLGYWKLDEPFGSTVAFDWSGNARHGTYTGTVVPSALRGADVRGVGAGFYPQFSDGYVSIADNAVFTLATTPGLSWFAMIKPDDITTTGHKFIITKGNTGAFEWQLSINIPDGGKLNLASFRSTTGTAHREDRTNADEIGLAWQGIGATRAGGLYTDVSTLHRNSGTALTLAIPTTSSVGTNDNTASAVMIGARGDQTTGALLWDGGLAHVAMFAGVLTAANFTSIMDAARLDGWYA